MLEPFDVGGLTFREGAPSPAPGGHFECSIPDPDPGLGKILLAFGAGEVLRVELGAAVVATHDPEAVARTVAALRTPH